MTDVAPPWSHVVGRMAAVGCRTARGALRYEDPETEPGVTLTGAVRFRFAAPDHWRVEDDDGVRHVQGPGASFLRDEDGRLQRLSADATFAFSGYGHPRTLLAGGAERFADPDDFSVPNGPGAAVTVAGRHAWEYVLATPPRKPHPLRVAVDDETGCVLRVTVPEVGLLVEMTAFEPDVALEDGVFGWGGPVATDWAHEAADGARRRRWLETERLPVPRWWPGGVGYHPLTGDPATGAFAVLLEVAEGAELARWPLGGEPPEGWAQRWAPGGTAGSRTVHAWTDDRWHWNLVVGEPLDDADLQRVVDSLPSAGGGGSAGDDG